MLSLLSPRYSKTGETTAACIVTVRRASGQSFRGGRPVVCFRGWRHRLRFRRSFWPIWIRPTPIRLLRRLYYLRNYNAVQRLPIWREKQVLISVFLGVDNTVDVQDYFDVDFAQNKI